MLGWLFDLIRGPIVAAQALSFGAGPSDITTSFRYTVDVQACLLAPYEDCTPEFCSYAPEGTFGLYIKEMQHPNRSHVMLFSRAYQFENHNDGDSIFFGFAQEQPQCFHRKALEPFVFTATKQNNPSYMGFVIN